MSKLDALMERARTLPLEEQDALADEMQDWIDQYSTRGSLASKSRWDARRRPPRAPKASA